MCVCAICDAMGYCNSTVCVCVRVCLYVEYACFDGWCLTRLSKHSRYLYFEIELLLCLSSGPVKALALSSFVQC